MAQSRRAPTFVAGDGSTLLLNIGPIEWACPGCSVAGAVEAIDNMDGAWQAVMAHHNMFSAHCLSRPQMLVER
jgi:hypothetical protein